MRDLQVKIQQFCEKNKLALTPEYRALDLVSEIGEVAKEILQQTNYGQTKNIAKTNELTLEIGDVFYSLIVLANSLDIDLETALKSAMEKYQNRATRGSIGSEND